MSVSALDPRRRPLIRRILRFLGAGVGLLVMVVMGAVVGLFLALDHPSTRRLAVTELNAILAPQFRGRITIERLGHLSVFGVNGVDATVTSADGTRVLVARGASARISPIALVRGAVFGKGDRHIHVDAITVDAIEADLDSEPDGSVKLVGAFDSKAPSPPPAPGARGIDIELPSISVQHTWLHGVIAGVPPIDADVDGLAVAVLSTPHVTELDVPHLMLAARGLPMGVTPHGRITGHLETPAASGAGMGVTGAFDGGLGEIPLTANVTLQGDALDGVADVPEVSAAQVQASIEAAPIYGAVVAHGEAHGDLSHLKVMLRARLGPGSVELDGVVAAKGALGGRVDLAARNIDARTFSNTAPATSVGIRVAAAVETEPDKALVAHADIDIPVGTAAGQTVPHTTMTASVVRRVSVDGPPTFTGHLEGAVEEPGAPIALTADGRSRGTVSSLTLGAKMAVRRLEDVTRVRNLGSGKVDATLEGRVDIATGVIFAGQVDASVDHIQSGAARVAHATLVAKARGTPSQPDLEARVLASGVSASGYAFSRLEAEVAGGLEKAKVAVAARGVRAPDVKLRADVVLNDGIHIDDLVLGLSRGGRALSASVDSLRVARGSVEASGIDLEGAGSPLHASLKSSPGSLAVKAKSSGLDLGALAYLAGQDRKLGGYLALDVDVHAQLSHAKGKVSIDLTKGEWSAVRDGQAHVDIELEGRHIQGGLRTLLGDAGSLDLRDLDVHVGGDGPLTAEGWRRAWGRATLSADLDLARVAAVSPPGLLPVSDLTGRIFIDGHVARDSLDDVTPEVRLSFRTANFSAAGRVTPPVRLPGGPLMVGPAPWTLRGVDLGGDLIIGGEDSAGELAIRVVDKVGGLVALDVKTAALPFGSALGGDGNGDLLAQLERLPMSILVGVPLRELGALPLIIRPDGVSGAAQLTLAVSGSALDPQVDLEVQAHALTLSAAPKTPVDGRITAHYDGTNGHASMALHSGSSQLLSAEADVKLSTKGLLDGSGNAPAWGASVKADLSRFPLGAISLLADDQVRGFVSGNVSVTGLHDDAAAKVELSLDELRIGAAAISKGHVEVSLDDQGLNANATLEAASGSLQADAKMGMSWGAELAPSPDGAGLSATLRAKHFSAEAVAPFLSGFISKLSGWIDADAKVSLANGNKPSMSGSIAFSEGVIQTPSLGEEFHGVKARLTLAEDGSVKLEDAEAHGLSGKVTFTGGARIDGTTLLGADLALDIHKGEGIPLDIRGSNLGSVYGTVALKATGASDGKSLKVAVTVPHFHVDLPDAALPRSPQGLGDAASVHMGVYRSADRFLVLSTDGAPVKLVAERNLLVKPLASAGGGTPSKPVEPPAGQAEALKIPSPTATLDVSIKLEDVQVVRGQQLAINLDGSLNAQIAAATVVRGEIHLKSGKLNVQSKEFTIDKGTISFVGNDPANPEVNVTAGWGAPDGTRVLADFIGPVKTGKVTLRSEPPRPKNEIVSLIFFGTADGSSATPYASKSPSTGTQAGTAVGGLATDGLSKGLDQITGMNVTTKVDTSDSANPRPEVEVQIAKDISLQLAFVLGTPPPGTNPDTSYATIDWRFVRNWSLETTFGDYGSTFADLVWQYRY